MKRLDLEFRKIDLQEFKKRTALLSDVSKIITDDVMIYVDNQPVLLYTKLTDDTSHLRWAVKNVKYSTGKRFRGLLSQSAIFGYTPRNVIRHDYCTITYMAEKQPKQHHIISSFIKNIVGYYERYFPDTYQKHKEIVSEKVLPDWTIKDTPFTSGIVNKNNPLKYHLDSGNFKGLLSNMVVFKKGTSGGHLVIPELDLALEVADNTLTIFNGQEILHGVSPIVEDEKDGYRYSVVYYSLEQMWKCDPIDDEIVRIREMKTEREINRLDPEHHEKLKNYFGL